MTTATDSRKTREQLGQYVVRLTKPFQIEYRWEGGLVLARTEKTEIEALQSFKFFLAYCEQHRPNAVVTLYFAPRKLSERAVVKSIDLSR